MTNIIWLESVNTRVLRNGTSWNEVQGFITDITRSGKTKRRLASSMQKQTFTVKFLFSLAEYTDFRNWYKNTILYGSRSFLFPEIDSQSGSYVEYQIAEGGSPQYSNPTGDKIECTMKWERV